MSERTDPALSDTSPSAASSAPTAASPRRRRWFAAAIHKRVTPIRPQEHRHEADNHAAHLNFPNRSGASLDFGIINDDSVPPASDIAPGAAGATRVFAATITDQPLPPETDAGKSDADARELATGGVFMSHFASEEQREPAYEAELLKLFRVRLRLVALLTMIALPIFMLFQVTLSGVGTMVIGIYGALFTLCILTRVLARRMTRLNHIRMLSLLVYGLFCLGAGLVVLLMGNKQIYILGRHNHIVLTVLLLPYSVWECFAVGLIAIVALALSGWWVLFPQQSHLYFSHLFILCTTTVFVVIVAHFQSELGRRAFDTAFDLRRAARRLQTLSFLDTLTGGFNRRYFETVLETEIARAIRFERPLSVLMFDLDNFKTVNDTLGHAAGDDVLREVWNATLMTIREVDTAARYGGDEFAIVLPETDEEAARAIAGRLQKTAQDTLNRCFGCHSRESQVTLSIGITTTRARETVSVQALMERADQRLYAAKRNGKNNIAS